MGKEAVSALTEHVAIRQALQQNKLEIVKEEMLDDGNASNAVRLDGVKVLSKDHRERMETLKANMQKNAEVMEKREQMKAMLEKQVELEEKRTIEQNKIAQMREKMLEMKMRELCPNKGRTRARRARAAHQSSCLQSLKLPGSCLLSHSQRLPMTRRRELLMPLWTSQRGKKK